jgi:hypothetical protein
VLGRAHLPRKIVGVLTYLHTAIAAVALVSSAPVEDLAARREVVNRTADLVERRYVDPASGARIAGELRRRSTELVRGGTPEDFAKAFTSDLRIISGDGHFAVEYRPEAKAAADGEVVDPAELERWYGAHVNNGFEQVSRLDEGIGYLDLRVFAPTSMAGDLASAAMSLLAQSPALIIDLRRNGGGDDGMTRLLAAYLLDGRQEMSAEYDRPSGHTKRNFTPAEVPGRRFGARKPVYLLVSHRTFSAAEAFAYDLQAMKRAIVVGEQTGGGAHPSEYRPISHGFILSLPEGRSVNPITGTDWERVGVTPDVRVPADSALSQALILAKEAIRATRSRSVGS